ncbi:AAA family ATPase [Curtobacterium sp. NPDC086286]|uniref:AAA family ATPase n=1 Tax=Curtobacterium sp. NPDC086286 TaxID=3363964 RepID=UPI0037F7C5C7
MIVWINGTHGVGKTTTSRLVQPLLPDARVLDPEKVGETLMDVRPPLPDSGDFQHWDPWRPLVVETARQVLAFAGGTLVMPQTVLVERYWREIADGFAAHGIPVRHFVLHAEEETLRDRIQNDAVVGPSTFRSSRVDPYAEAARTWLHAAAEVVDTTDTPPEQVARNIADAVLQVAR